MATAEDARVLDQRRQLRPPPVNPEAPRLTKDDYFTVPDMRRLRRMADDELKVCVPGSAPLVLEYLELRRAGKSCSRSIGVTTLLDSESGVQVEYVLLSAAFC